MKATVTRLDKGGSGFALATIRLGDSPNTIVLQNVGVWMRKSGSIRIRAPRITTRQGSDVGPAWRLRRQARAAVVEAVARAWAEAASGAR